MEGRRAIQKEMATVALIPPSSGVFPRTYVSIVY